MSLLSNRLQLFCLLLLAVPALGVQAATDAAPGRSVGHVFLGMDRADVWKILGRPKRTAAVPHGMDLYGEDDWTSGNYHTLTVISRHDKVIQIEFDSPRLITTDGLSAQKSTFAQIRRRHPVMTVRVRPLHYLHSEEKPTGDNYCLDDVRGGIAFTCGFDIDYASDSLKYSLFFNDVTPDSIIIHRPGVMAVPIHAGRWSAPSASPAVLRLLRSWFSPDGSRRKK